MATWHRITTRNADYMIPLKGDRQETYTFDNYSCDASARELGFMATRLAQLSWQQSLRFQATRNAGKQKRLRSRQLNRQASADGCVIVVDSPTTWYQVVPGR